MKLKLKDDYDFANMPRNQQTSSHVTKMKKLIDMVGRRSLTVEQISTGQIKSSGEEVSSRQWPHTRERCLSVSTSDYGD